MAFCDFCDCKTCQDGCKNLSHAKTDKNTWICDVCYDYDLCTSGPNRNKNGPCEDKDCKHRPKLISDWIGWKENISPFQFYNDAYNSMSEEEKEQFEKEQKIKGEIIMQELEKEQRLKESEKISQCRCIFDQPLD